jgi:glycine dehydrogenase subunit 1
MTYTPNPPQVVQEMLEAMGLRDINELFIDIPEELHLSRELDLGESLSELELRKKMNELAGKNVSIDDYPSFLGAGAYDHYIPAVVEHGCYEKWFSMCNCCILANLINYIVGMAICTSVNI